MRSDASARLAGDVRSRLGLDQRERARNLGSALARMARDLADARRELDVLRRENAALRREISSREHAAIRT